MNGRRSRHGGRRPPAVRGSRKGSIMLMRFEPFREFDRITEEMLTARRVRKLPVDAYRRGDEFKIALDLPGVDPGSIELTIEKDVLAVGATRTSYQEEGDEILVAERGHGQFSRQLFVGE